MFPSSNSTLYYEQARKQLDELSKHNVIKIPIRLIGLFEKMNDTVPALWTQYSSNRYSRTINNRTSIECNLMERSKKGICKINIIGE
jgi:hypothetical protein